MKLFNKLGMVLTGLLVSFGCLAVEPPCWKLESEGAAQGDVCWFSDKMPSGTVYFMSKVVVKNGKAVCFHEGEKEDRSIKQFGWLNADWESLRTHNASQQNIKSFVGSFKWCSDNKETRKRGLPVVNVSEIPEETVNLVTVVEEGVEYLTIEILSSASGDAKRLGKFYKNMVVASGEMLTIWVYMGCQWAMYNSQGLNHHDKCTDWAKNCFNLNYSACSFDHEGNWQHGNWLDASNCDGSNVGFKKIQVPASVLPEDVVKSNSPRK